MCVCPLCILCILLPDNISGISGGRRFNAIWWVITVLMKLGAGHRFPACQFSSAQKEICSLFQLSISNRRIR